MLTFTAPSHQKRLRQYLYKKASSGSKNIAHHNSVDRKLLKADAEEGTPFKARDQSFMQGSMLLDSVKSSPITQ